jgi:hypothetical protein
MAMLHGASLRSLNAIECVQDGLAELAAAVEWVKSRLAIEREAKGS